MSWGVAASHGGAVIIGFALGIGYMGWHTGAWTTSGGAADRTQIAVDTAAKDADEQGAKDDEADRAAQRVRTGYIPVDKQCTPGAGPVSAGINAELFDAFTKAAPGTSAREIGLSTATE